MTWRDRRTRLLAMYYGQPPDFFDLWTAAEVEREVLILKDILEDGQDPIASGVLTGVAKAFGGGK